MTELVSQRPRNGALSVLEVPDGSCCHVENLRYPDGRVAVVVSEPCENHREGLL